MGGQLTQKLMYYTSNLTESYHLTFDPCATIPHRSPLTLGKSSPAGWPVNPIRDARRLNSTLPVEETYRQQVVWWCSRHGKTDEAETSNKTIQQVLGAKDEQYWW